MRRGKTVLDTPCKEWTGRRNAKGYGVDGHGRLVHRLVVEETEGVPLGSGEIVMHRCDNPPCIEYSHLLRATQAENVADRDRKGRRVAPQGEASSNAKLTAKRVREIRASKESQRALAKRFGVSKNAIRLVQIGESWRYVS
jgi:hypothetical protein